ncbi:MAG: cation:proton antiporter [Treponema sp.]|nr:cation:proton antiporter [Treponema sp.]
METIEILRQLAIIIIFAKLFGLTARRLKAPQVAGEIVAGLIIGPSLLGWVQPSQFLAGMAEIGVILLMFNAGLGTNINELKRSGLKATLIACAGVFIPLVCGTILFMFFFGFDKVGSERFYKAIYIGTILTATSVSITVQTLKELGKLKNFTGTTIVSAAIIDDVIGIIVLTVVIGFKDPSSNTLKVVLNTALFFVFALVAGYLFYRIFKIVEKRYNHTRRIPIVGLALAFSMSYIAQHFFNVADITGAYIAGVILCSTKDSDYIARKMDINSYMLFGPVFFASIGLATNIKNIDTTILFFSLAFVLVGMGAKVIGCGLMAKLCRFNRLESLKIGCGMMTRGEVALIVAQRGLAAGLLEHTFFTAVILLIIISSITTPIILKALYSKDKESEQGQVTVAN